MEGESPLFCIQIEISSKIWKEMRECGIMERCDKGVFMDISEIRQKIDANREKLASFRRSL